MTSRRDEKLFGAGPKRILALDGGGVRGIVALAFLERLEALLHERFGAGFRLADYFDLIGGTSTGAIIATGLAMGLDTAQLIATYRTLAQECFQGSHWLGGLIVPKFRSEPLVAVIRRQLGEETLGSERLLTGLAIVAKRIDTGSTWVFHNNPRGPFFNPEGAGATVNKDLPLAQLIRASTAAPTFFAPEHIEVARGVSGTFVDGGVSPHKNPALLLFMLATLGGYGFRWPTGDDRLMLLSLGTGQRPMTAAALPPRGAPSVALAALALHSVIEDCSWLGQAMLQWLGTSPAPWRIDSEVGDLAGDRLGERSALFYQRYDLIFSPDWLAEKLGIAVGERELAELSRMDHPELAARLLELGRAAARRQISAEHLPSRFDPATSC
jgi:uncharacterized protein